MDPIKETWHGYPHLYKRGTEKGGAVVPPLKTPLHLGRTWTKCHQRSKQKLQKDVTDFAAGSGNCLKGSQACGDTATISLQVVLC